MAAEQMTGTLRRFELGPEGTGLEEMATLSQYLVYATNLEELIIEFGHPCSRIKGDVDWIYNLCMYGSSSHHALLQWKNCSNIPPRLLR